MPIAYIAWISCWVVFSESLQAWQSIRAMRDCDLPWTVRVDLLGLHVEVAPEGRAKEAALTYWRRAELYGSGIIVAFVAGFFLVLIDQLPFMSRSRGALIVFPVLLLACFTFSFLMLQARRFISGVLPIVSGLLGVGAVLVIIAFWVMPSFPAPQHLFGVVSHAPHVAPIFKIDIMDVGIRVVFALAIMKLVPIGLSAGWRLIENALHTRYGRERFEAWMAPLARREKVIWRAILGLSVLETAFKSHWFNLLH